MGCPRDRKHFQPMIGEKGGRGIISGCSGWRKPQGQSALSGMDRRLLLTDRKRPLKPPFQFKGTE